MSNIFAKALNNHQNTGNLTRTGTGPFFMNLGDGPEKVSERTSLSLSSFYSSVQIISDHIASLPLNIIKRDATGNTEDEDHYLNEILTHQSNQHLDAVQFKKILWVNALTFGNGFARIERKGSKVTGLHLEEPKDVDVLRNRKTGEIFYEFKDIDRIYPQRDVIHIFDFSLNGHTGLSVLEAGARNAFQSHISVENFDKKYFENNANIGGILSTEESLGNDPNVVNEAKSEVRSEFEKLYTGENNHFRTAILEGSWDYTQLDIKASDAMLVERSKATVEDISRWTRVPLSMLAHTDSQSYKSRESEARAYVQNCLAPKIKIMETELRNKLFTPGEKSSGYQVLIDTKSLIRSNTKDMGEFLSRMVDRSIFDVNDALKWLGMDTLPEEQNRRLKQKNMEFYEDSLNGKAGEDREGED